MCDCASERAGLRASNVVLGNNIIPIMWTNYLQLAVFVSLVHCHWPVDDQGVVLGENSRDPVLHLADVHIRVG